MKVSSAIGVLSAMNAIARGEIASDSDLVESSRPFVCAPLAREKQFAAWRELLTKGTHISAALNFLREAGWLGRYPELERLVGCRQDPQWHPEGDVWQHTLCCLNAFAADRGKRRAGDDEDLIVGLAVLCHDLGKPFCTSYDPVRKRIRSLGHDERGVGPTVEFLRRITDDERLLAEVPPLVRLHMRPFAMWRDNASDGAIRRVMRQVGRIDRLIRVAAADDAGRPPFPSEPEPLVWLERASARIAAEDSVPAPLVRGRHLLAMGMRPGPAFKRILDAAYAAQLEGCFQDLASALAFVSSLDLKTESHSACGGDF